MNKALASLVVLALAINQAAAVPIWGQCDGLNYTGSKTCDAGLTCVFLNDWYSQCQNTGSNPQPTTTQQPPTTNPPVTNPPITTNPPTGGGSGLDARFKAKGKQYWGTCGDSNTLNIQQNANVIRQHFGQVTPENAMKWDATEPSRGSFSFSGADAVVNFATQNNLLVRGHTLVWHSQLPGWVSNIGDSSTLTTVIQNHVSQVMGRFKGKIFEWDVVNEIFNEDGSLRSSVFSRVLGENFVRVAFQAARQADPACKLYINDYNLDSNNAKVRGLVALVNRINSGTKLIDGIGTQAHLEANGAGGVQAALQALAATGLDVAITELDIKNAASNDYTTVVRACLAVPQCVGITSWGVSDKNSWRSQNNPLLFDGNYQAKPALTAILNLLA